MTGAPIMLLHCYPYHRQAAYLANVFRTSTSMSAWLSRTSGTAPPRSSPRRSSWRRSTSSCTPPTPTASAELYLLAAATFRAALAELLPVRPPRAERDRIAELLGSGNARRVYSLARSS